MTETLSNLPTALLRMRHVSCSFRHLSGQVDVLRGADLAVQPGEIVGLVAPSGAGKSTLLHIAGLLQRPSSGLVVLGGHHTGGLSDSARAALRLSAIGFVYQFPHLLPEFTAVENVMLPGMMAGLSRTSTLERARVLLRRVGLLKERESHRPAKLSGGEQQRVAIARALMNKPALLLADEPTGNLEPRSAAEVFGLFRSLVSEMRFGALIASHNPTLIPNFDRLLTLVSGRIITYEPGTIEEPSSCEHRSLGYEGRI